MNHIPMRAFGEIPHTASDFDELEPRRNCMPAPPHASEPAQEVSAPAPEVPRHFRETVAPRQRGLFLHTASGEGTMVLSERIHETDVEVVRVPPRGATPIGLAGDAATRKAAPICSGMLWYFPNACAALAALSKIGNDQHNPGQPMHWAYDKSTDEADCIVRHLAQSGTVDIDGVRHATKVAWRALALLERELLAAHPELQPGRNVKGFVR